MIAFNRREVTVGALLAASGLATTRAHAAPSGNVTIAMPTLGEQTFLPWTGSTGRKFYLDTICEYLAYIDPVTRDLKPGLAESWAYSADGKTITLKIRQGVPFQRDVGMFTAEDAKYSLDRIRDPKAVAGPSSALRATVESVEAPDAATLVIKLKQPDVEFVRGYLSNGLSVAMVSKSYVERVGDAEANAKPVGTGAYQLDELKKDISIRVKVVGNVASHWRNKDAAFETLTFRAAPEQSTRVAMLQTGEADLAPIAYDSIETVKKAGLNIISVKNAWTPVIRLGGLTVKFPNPNVPWAKEKVRQALNLAIDKQAIVKEIFQNEGSVASTDFWSKETSAVAPFPYDPTKAKQLLAEAGYPNGFDIEIRSYATTPGAELPSIAEAVAIFWQAIGVRVKISPTDWGTVRSAWTSGKATDVVWVHRGFPFPAALAGYEAGYYSASLFSSYATTDVDKQIEAIRAAVQPDARAQATVALAQSLRDQGANVFIAHVNEPYGVSKKIKSWPSLSEQVTNMDLITRA